MVHALQVITNTLNLWLPNKHAQKVTHVTIALQHLLCVQEVTIQMLKPLHVQSVPPATNVQVPTAATKQPAQLATTQLKVK
jgi:hypothetical protein